MKYRTGNMPGKEYPFRVLIQWIDDRAAIDTLIWKTRDDDCINRKWAPSLVQAIREIKKSGEPFCVFDGVSYFPGYLF